MISTNDIRTKFLTYFEQNGHTIFPSAPLVPQDDPSLLFVNAGMVPFKNVFTGRQKLDTNRATTSQKCVRAGGKHNDLDNVGYTARHHTFFEMMGNFSFGDYFKEQAIFYAWDLLTKGFSLPAEKLLVTVYHDDDEAFNLWKKIAGLSDDRIIRISTSDNFWSMGSTGPCGPCSEVFYDHGPSVWGGRPGTPEEDGDRFIEIWNLVFMQYEQPEQGDRIVLPRPSIDTGLGLERMAALLQGKHDNYDIDLFRTLIEASAHFTGQDPDGTFKRAHRVVADHLRSCSFLISDGVLPSNEGRGYVLRRIMRRAMRYAHILGAKDPLMHRLVPTLVGEMGGAFPDLSRNEKIIVETLRVEEEKFRNTLERGLSLLTGELGKLGEKDALSGQTAFKLYDTYGFPLDLTEDILREQGRALDKEGFTQAMEAQKEVARASWVGAGSQEEEDFWFGVHSKQGNTTFVGYTQLEASSKIQVLAVEGKDVQALEEGQKGSLVAVQTPFYAESGGQIGDSGRIETSEGACFRVERTFKKAGGVWVHQGYLEKGSLKVGETIQLQVNAQVRKAVCRNHSATHLLHEALRQTLGEHVAQRGSLVDAGRLRFDFSHGHALSAEEKRQVEALVSERICFNTSVETELMSPEQAIEKGAMALFGEKYGKQVRVVSMGGLDEAKSTADKERVFSMELCGGTHVERTGDIGAFQISVEEASASGVRRIEALTGVQALERHQQTKDNLDALAEQLKVNPAALLDRVQGLQEEVKFLKTEVKNLQHKMVAGTTESSAEGQTINGVTYVGKVLEDVPAKELKALADTLKRKIGSGIVALISGEEGKVSVVVAVTSDLVEKYSAIDLVRLASATLGGKGGGGRPDMAQAGGTDKQQAQTALQDIATYIEQGATHIEQGATYIEQGNA